MSGVLLVSVSRPTALSKVIVRSSRPSFINVYCCHWLRLEMRQSAIFALQYHVFFNAELFDRLKGTVTSAAASSSIQGITIFDICNILFPQVARVDIALLVLVPAAASS